MEITTKMGIRQAMSVIEEENKKLKSLIDDDEDEDEDDGSIETLDDLFNKALDTHALFSALQRASVHELYQALSGLHPNQLTKLQGVLDDLRDAPDHD